MVQDSIPGIEGIKIESNGLRTQMQEGIKDKEGGSIPLPILQQI